MRAFEYLGDFKIYWKLRALVARIQFEISTRLFRARYGLKEEGISLQTFLQFLSITIPQLVFAITFAFMLRLLDIYLSDIFQYTKWGNINYENYTTLFSTIAGIGGIFIGLYYAGVTTVGSAMYSRVPNNIRDLLVRERVGNVYMRFLAFLTFLNLTLVGFRALGIPPVRIAVIVNVILSGIGIISFVKLGQRAFYLFDPTALSDAIFQELHTLVKRTTVGGFGWAQGPFQDHARKQARRAVNALITLADICERETNLSGRPFLELCQKVVSFLNFYQFEKRKIPSDSHWYERRMIQRDWYRTEDSTVSIAHRTGTTIGHESTANNAWLEEQLNSIVFSCLRINQKELRHEIVIELLGYVDAYLQTLASEGNLTSAISLLEQIMDLMLGELAKPAEKPVLQSEVLENLGLMDYLGALPISIFLSFSKSICSWSSEDLTKQMQRVRWSSRSSLYKQEFKSYLLPQLEWLWTRLNFEIASDDEVISPLWYQCEIVRKIEAEGFSENTAIVLNRIPTLYQQWTNTCNANKHPWLNAALTSREWEYCHKLQSNISEIAETWSKIDKDHYVKGLRWPTIDSSQWAKHTSDLQDELTEKMISISTILSASVRPSNFPDYGGQFLHAAGEAVFDCLISGNSERIRRTFPLYFLTSLKKFDDLRPKSVATDDETIRQFRIAGAPLLDLLDLSGYSKLFADLHGNPDLWKAFTDTWDKYLKDKSPSPLGAFSAVIGLTQSHFAIPHRGILRTGWHQRVGRELANLPTKQVVRGELITVDTVAIHSSPLVRLFAQDTLGSFYGGVDIFVSFYLSKHPQGTSLQWGNKSTQLEESLKRQERYYEHFGEKPGEAIDEPA